MLPATAGTLSQTSLASQLLQHDLRVVPPHRDSLGASKDALLRAELDNDRLRQLLTAAELEREGADRRAVRLQQRLEIEGDLRESLKAELRAGVTQLHQEISESLRRISTEVRGYFGAESARLQQTFARASSLWSRQDLGPVAGAIDKLSQQVAVLAGGDTMAIVEEIRKVKGTLTTFNEKRAEVDLSPIVDLVGAQRGEIDSHFGRMHQALAEKLERRATQQDLARHREELGAQLEKIHSAVQQQRDLHTQLDRIHRAVMEQKDTGKETKSQLDLSAFDMSPVRDEEGRKAGGIDHQAHYDRLHNAILEMRKQSETFFDGVHKAIVENRVEVNLVPVHDALQRIRETRTEVDLTPLHEAIAVQKGQAEAHFDRVHKSLLDSRREVDLSLEAIRSHREDMESRFDGVHRSIQESRPELDLQPVHDAMNARFDRVHRSILEGRQNVDLRSIQEAMDSHFDRFHRSVSEKEVVDLRPLQEAIELHGRQVGSHFDRVHKTITESRVDVDLGPVHDAIASIRETTTEVDLRPLHEAVESHKEHFDRIHRSIMDSRVDVDLQPVHAAISSLREQPVEVDMAPLRDTILTRLSQTEAALEQLRDLIVQAKVDGHLAQLHSDVDGLRQMIAEVHKSTTQGGEERWPSDPDSTTRADIDSLTTQWMLSRSAGEDLDLYARIEQLLQDNAHLKKADAQREEVAADLRKAMGEQSKEISELLHEVAEAKKAKEIAESEREAAKRRAMTGKDQSAASLELEHLDELTRHIGAEVDLYTRVDRLVHDNSHLQKADEQREKVALDLRRVVAEQSNELSKLRRELADLGPGDGMSMLVPHGTTLVDLESLAGPEHHKVSVEIASLEDGSSNAAAESVIDLEGLGQQLEEAAARGGDDGYRKDSLGSNF